jgi:hypothetical protein
MARQSSFTQRHRSGQLIAGLDKHGDELGGAHVLGRTRSVRELKAMLKAHLDAADAASSLRAAYAASVAKLRAAEQVAGAVAKQVKYLVGARYGNDPVKWADFGMVPDKVPGPKTVAAKLAGAKTGALTRKARGTMGPRQRKKAKAARGG